MAGIKRTPLDARFWSKVRKSDGCWIWQRQLNNKGYGCFAFYPRSVRASTNEYAHRVAWMLTHGAIPDGMCVLHKCDTPACVRPDHLFLGTQLENIDDRDAKGRVRHGSQHPFARLTDDDVRAIRRDTRVQTAIARAYGIHQMTVSDIKRGVTWKHVV